VESFKKLKNRKITAEKKKRSAFVDNLDNLFDISQANELDKIVLQEDRDFHLV